MVRIHIRTLDGAVDLPLEVYLTTKVEEVMLLIREKKNIELIDQRLIFINTILEKERSLMEYRIQSEDVLHLILGASVNLTQAGIIVEKNRLFGKKISSTNIAFRAPAKSVAEATVIVRDRLGIVNGVRENQMASSIVSPTSSSSSPNNNSSATPKEAATVENDGEKNNKASSALSTTEKIPKGDFISIDRFILPPVLAAGRPVPFENFNVTMNVAGTKFRCKFYPRVDDNPSLNIVHHLKEQVLLHFGLTKRHLISSLYVQLDDAEKTKFKFETDEELLLQPLASRTFFAELDFVPKLDWAENKNPVILIDTSRSIGRGTMTESFACNLSYAPPPTPQQLHNLEVSANHLTSMSNMNNNVSATTNNHHQHRSIAALSSNSSSSSSSPLRRDHPHSVVVSGSSPSANQSTALTGAAAAAGTLLHMRPTAPGINVPAPLDPTRYIAKRLFCFDPHDGGYLLDEKKKIADAHELSLKNLQKLQPHPNLLFPVARICQEVKQRFRGVERSIGEATVFMIYPRYEFSLSGFLGRIGRSDNNFNIFNPLASSLSNATAPPPISFNAPPALALTILRRVTDGLKHLHKFDTVHGAVTPRNVLFQFNTNAMLPSLPSSAMIENPVSPLTNPTNANSQQQQPSTTITALISNIISSTTVLQSVDVRLTDWRQPELLAEHGPGETLIETYSNRSTAAAQSPTSASQSPQREPIQNSNNAAENATNVSLDVSNINSINNTSTHVSPSPSNNLMFLNYIAPELRNVVAAAAADSMQQQKKAPTKETDLWQLGVLALQLFDALEDRQHQCLRLSQLVEEAKDFAYEAPKSLSAVYSQNNTNNNNTSSSPKLPRHNGLIEEVIPNFVDDYDEALAAEDPSEFSYRDPKEFFKHDVSRTLLFVAEGLLCFEPSKRQIRIL